MLFYGSLGVFYYYYKLHFGNINEDNSGLSLASLFYQCCLTPVQYCRLTDVYGLVETAAQRETSVQETFSGTWLTALGVARCFSYVSSHILKRSKKSATLTPCGWFPLWCKASRVTIALSEPLPGAIYRNPTCRPTISIRNRNKSLRMHWILDIDIDIYRYIDI